MTQVAVAVTKPDMVAPTFDDALVKRFNKDINYLISKKVFNYNTSDMCYESEDVYQECLMHLWNATKIYDPTKGMKFRTFAIFHLQSRLGNFRNKVTRRNKNETVSMSELNGGWGIVGCEESGGESAAVSSQYRGYVEGLKNGQDCMNEIIDAKKVLDKLEGNRKLLFSEFYIKGKKIKEICEENPDLKYYQIRRHMKYIDQIYKTLIKGETPCLMN